jgi:hypothetical protein
VGNLHVADVDLNTESVRFHGKGAKDRRVRFGPKTARALSRYLRARDNHKGAELPNLWLADRGAAPLTPNGIEAPQPIRDEVTRLAVRLQRGWRLRDALQAYATELADPTADLVVAGLLVAARGSITYYGHSCRRARQRLGGVGEPDCGGRVNCLPRLGWIELTARARASSTSGCDVDGSPQTPGCGWYVDIAHAGSIATRYCHMLTHPYVHEGQTVAVGQVIGIVGSSEHSSGPHLHFEVHVSETPTDPIPFMASMCAPLGLVDPPATCQPADNGSVRAMDRRDPKASRSSVITGPDRIFTSDLPLGNSAVRRQRPLMPISGRRFRMPPSRIRVQEVWPAPYGPGHDLE